MGAGLIGLCIAVGGYMLTGSPGMPAAPAPRAPLDAGFTPEAEQASPLLMERFGDARDWLTASEAMIRAGRTETAVYILDQATERLPGNVDLWVQLGIALVAHSGGQVVPAARLAFDRASRLDPIHPAPAYFLGLAYLQAGEPDRALPIWRDLLARSSADAPWRPELERLIHAGETMQAMGVGDTPG